MARCDDLRRSNRGRRGAEAVGSRSSTRARTLFRRSPAQAVRGGGAGVGRLHRPSPLPPHNLRPPSRGAGPDECQLSASRSVWLFIFGPCGA